MDHKNEDKAVVRIGNETKAFKLTTLKQLEYFDAVFSDRWQASQNKASSSNSNSNSKESQSITIFDSEDYATFGLDDFEKFLNCYKCKDIPNDMILDLKQMESLLNCYDFFCMQSKGDINNNNNNNNNNNKQKNNKIQQRQLYIDKTKLIQYFQHRIPPITVTQRQEWLIKSNNIMIRQALAEYNQLLSNRLSAVLGNTILQQQAKHSVSKLTSIKYDSDTAAAIFKSKFSIVITHVTISKLVVKIVGFDNTLALFWK